ncbi:lamin tail domain-containing protein 1 isoform X1 [Oxyura jamaicensis]|uniref:lamin tail domain-containing protein 1 isoform X1 n=1 Tax=Oxyura jamaicensis TaxID=8884 RepID=UPI0015A645F7|nr:lamin tail domain-containing protein 1 isoform X1 [Oxyura jamaicensis]
MLSCDEHFPTEWCTLEYAEILLLSAFSWLRAVRKHEILLPRSKHRRRLGRIMSSWKVKLSYPEMCLENRTETTAFQLSSDISVASKITPCSTVDVSMYSSDMSFVDLSHSASVTGTTESSSSAQSYGLAHTLQSRTIAQLRDGTEIPDREPGPPRNLSLPLTVSRQCQDYFSPLLIDSGQTAQSLRCILMEGSVLLMRTTTRTLHPGTGTVEAFPLVYFCREEMVFCEASHLE